MLRIEIVNTKKVRGNLFNYRWAVYVNQTEIESGKILRHNRNSHWSVLVAKMLIAARGKLSAFLAFTILTFTNGY